MANTEGRPPSPDVKQPEIVVSAWLSPTGDSPGAFPRTTRSGGFLEKPEPSTIPPIRPFPG